MTAKQATSPVDLSELDLDLTPMCVKHHVQLGGVRRPLHEAERKATYRLVVEHEGGGHRRVRLLCQQCAKRAVTTLFVACTPCFDDLGVRIPIKVVRIEPL